MPKERKPQLDVLSMLKELSNEADDIIEKKFSTTKFPGLDDWFTAAKNVVLQIRDCDSIADIIYPKLSDFLGEEEKKVADVDTAVSEIQRVHVHANIQSTATVEHGNSEILPAISVTEHNPKCSDTKKISTKGVETPVVKSVETPAFKGVEMPAVKSIETTSFKGVETPAFKGIKTPAIKDIKTPALSIIANLKSDVLLQMSTPAVENTDSYVCVSENNTCGLQNLMQTPKLNRTFNMDINKTIVLNSQTASSSSQKTRILNAVYNDSGIKIKPDSKHLLVNKIISHSSGILTRSGSKRKSSPKSKTNKKQKVEVSETTTSHKTALSRQPLSDKNTRGMVNATENKTKVAAVIVPTMKKKSVVSKEEQIREEIKKKDEKANEAIKRVLAERQMKAEQIKKNREDKRTKTLQKRLQMEKEKERLQKAELENKKSQAKAIKENVKNSTMKLRTQELIEQHAKTSTCGALSSSNQNVSNGNALVKTPVQRKLDECQSYELTPLPNSSTYDFSDSDDENEKNGKASKPIPQWALGVHLKSALIHQYYNPPNIIELFGKEIDSPNLTEMFSVPKKHYLKRTSSAIWNSPPSSHH